MKSIKETLPNGTTDDKDKSQSQISKTFDHDYEYNMREQKLYTSINEFRQSLNYVSKTVKEQLVTNKDLEIEYDGETLNIPKGTKISNKFAGVETDPNYNFIDDFDWYKPELKGFARKVAIHDFDYRGINIDKENIINESKKDDKNKIIDTVMFGAVSKYLDTELNDKEAKDLDYVASLIDNHYDDKGFNLTDVKLKELTKKYLNKRNK